MFFDIAKHLNACAKAHDELNIILPTPKQLQEASEKLACDLQEYYNRMSSVLKPFIKQEKSKMTRQEAIQAAKCYGADNPEAHIKMLEELGLLKFEEEKKELSVIEIISSHCHSKLANAIIADLEKSGYRIVKLGKMTKFNEGAISWSIRLDDISQEQS